MAKSSYLVRARVGVGVGLGLGCVMMAKSSYLVRARVGVGVRVRVRDDGEELVPETHGVAA